MSALGIPEATGVHVVEMDPALATTIGLHHTVATAVADLVDNALDATAATVRIRILLDGSAPVGLQVIDDGRGMDATALDRAMRYSGTREYRSSDLGHFGVGLKAASLSQADTVLVCSRAYGATPVGRRLQRAGDRQAPLVGRIQSAAAEERLDAAGVGTSPGTGTVVEWRDVRSFPSTSDPEEKRRWLEGTVREVRTHLGLVLHRILATGVPVVTVDTWDIVGGRAGPARAVTAIDPFGYQRSGDWDFPEELSLVLPDGSEPVIAVAHIWPPGSQDQGFKIGGRPGEASQGFFVYRNDRLMQVGGWSGLWGPRPDWALARVALDLTAGAPKHVTINPEKSGITFSSDLRRALEGATCRISRLDLAGYLARAAGEDRRSRSRTRHPVRLVEPRSGMPASVLDAYRDTVEFDPSFPGVDIRWRTLPADQVFDVDVDGRVLTLNLRHRQVLVGHRSLDPDDAPVLKVLFHLLLGGHFAGFYLGDRDKREIAAWQALLLAAVDAQSEETP
jgi:hypothetical protein